MGEAIAAIGLASSIITFIDFSKEFGSLVREISKGQGSLPKELEECHEYVDIVAVWLEGARRLTAPISTTVEEDQYLQNAIQRCSQTAGELLVLLESVSRDPGPVEKRSLRQKTRGSIAHFKKAGKIIWKREQIIQIRDRLRADKDNVHHHISSRTGLQVVKLLEGQSQLDGNLQVIDNKIVLAFEHFQHLQLQNDHLVMQNHLLLRKVDFLCDVVAAMERDRCNRVIDIFDFLPPKPSITSVFLELKSAASTINEARRLLFDRGSRPKVGGREMMMRLANRPIPPEDFLSVQVIVESYFAPYFHRTSLVNFKRGDFRSSSALSKALRSGPEPIEAANISGFRSTTRITYVRFHHEEGRLSILESRCPGSSTDEYLRNIPDSLCVLRSLQPLDSFAPNRLGTQCSTSQASTDATPLEDWGIYVERGWDPWITIAVGPFNVYLVALETRLAAVALQYFEVVHDSTSCSLLLMFCYYMVFYPPMLAALYTRDDPRIRQEDFWMAFAWIRAFVVKHTLKGGALAVLLYCMLYCVLIKHMTLPGFVALMVFDICINTGVFNPQFVRVLSFWLAEETEHPWPVLMISSDGLKLLFRPTSRALLILLVTLVSGCTPLILPIVDSLIQTRTNISPIGMLSQTAKHTSTTINSIFGKKWLILIGIPLYIVTLWWFIGRMSYFEFMKAKPSAPQCSEHDLQLYKHALLNSFPTTNPLTNSQKGRKWTSRELRRFGRWRKHRYRKESKLCQRLRKVSRVKAGRSSCVK